MFTKFPAERHLFYKQIFKECWITERKVCALQELSVIKTFTRKKAKSVYQTLKSFTFNFFLLFNGTHQSEGLVVCQNIPLQQTVMFFIILNLYNHRHYTAPYLPHMDDKTSNGHVTLPHVQESELKTRILDLTGIENYF